MPHVKTQKIRDTEYVFILTSYRDTHDRLYLGKRIDGQFVPNTTYLRLSDEEKNQLGLVPLAKEPKELSKHGAPPASTVATRLFFGATYLFDQLAMRLGVTEDLKRCFPGVWEQILSVAWFLILEERTPLSRFPRWGKIHRHPYGKDITSPRSSELFGMITEDAMRRFFSLQLKRRVETEYFAYDSRYQHVLQSAHPCPAGEKQRA